VLPVSLDCPLFIATSVFSGLAIVYYNFGILKRLFVHFGQNFVILLKTQKF
jgi:hypothetical protein